VVVKTEDSDTDVDESVVRSETKPQDEPQSDAVIDDKKNAERENAGMKDSEVGNDKAELTAVKVEKTTDNDKVEESIDENSAEEKKDVVVIEDEEEDPEPELEVVEDRDDGGEDPSEVEVEKYNMPGEQALMTGTCLFVFPPTFCYHYLKEFSVTR